MAKCEVREWEVVSSKIREMARQVLGVTSGKAGRKKESWWWNDEVLEATRTKRETKGKKGLE